METTALLRAFCDAVEQHDGKAFAKLFTEDGVYHDVFYGAFKGHTKIAEMIDDVFYRTATDFRWDMHSPVSDGKTLYACSVLAIEMQGKTIRTVESFTEGTVLHPVQQAFCEHDGLMCGFCTPGFVTSVVALLEKNPKPTRAQAMKALDGNICRCGTYVRVLEAALDPKSSTGVRRG